MIYRLRRGLVAIKRDPELDKIGEAQIIIAPDSAKTRAMTGTIESIGAPAKIRRRVNGKKRWVEDPPQYAVGDRVVIGQAQGVKESVLGDNIFVVRQQDVYATIE